MRVSEALRPTPPPGRLGDRDEASPAHADGGPTEAPPATIISVRGGRVERRADRLVGEEPLQIRAAGPGQVPVDVAVTMRTPGHEAELAAGFLLTEGLATPSALRHARFEHGDPARIAQPHNETLVRLDTPFDQAVVAERHFVATASCGICGRATLDELTARCAPLPAGPVVPGSVLLSLPPRMRDAQRVFERTGGLHAAALFTPEGALVALREDVGRHNALDKIVGSQVLTGRLPLHDRVLLVSGRASFEIVQKAAVAGIPVLCAVSAPSDLAVTTAAGLGLSLVGFLRGDGYNVYTGEERIDPAR
jgi:FdhD protein